MRRPTTATLPPIAVEERPEKHVLTLSVALKLAIDEFTEYFETSTGSTAESFNAVVVGILTGYLESHGGFQKWRKARLRAGLIGSDAAAKV